MGDDVGPEPGPNAEALLVEDMGLGVRQLRLNRPSRLNALSVELVVALSSAVAEAVSDSVRVLLIRGTGRAFCAGADLKDRLGMTPDERRAHNRLINDALTGISAAPMPTVAVVNGLALGGGCELALACDVRIASAEAVFGLTELSVGAIPGAGGTQRLPRLIGAGNSLDLMLSSEPISADRAKAMGLVQRTYPNAELDERVLSYSQSIAEKSQTSTALLKRVVHAGLDLPLQEGLDLEAAAVRELFGSADYVNGLAAFTARRSATSGAGS